MNKTKEIEIIAPNIPLPLIDEPKRILAMVKERIVREKKCEDDGLSQHAEHTEFDSHTNYKF